MRPSRWRPSARRPKTPETDPPAPVRRRGNDTQDPRGSPSWAVSSSLDRPAATFKSRKPLAFNARHGDHHYAAAGNPTLIDARLSPRLSRHSLLQRPDHSVSGTFMGLRRLSRRPRFAPPSTKRRIPARLPTGPGIPAGFPAWDRGCSSERTFRPTGRDGHASASSVLA